MWTCAETPRHPLALPRLCSPPDAFHISHLDPGAPRVPAHTKKSQRRSRESDIQEDKPARVAVSRGVVHIDWRTRSDMHRDVCLASRVGPKEKLRASGANAPAVGLAPSATSTDLRLSHEALE